MKNNKLLQRQIKRYLPAECAANPALVPFLQAVAASYYAFDRDSLLSARAFKMSEEEYLEVNDKLQKELELKKISIHKLKAAIMETDVEGFSLDGDDLLEIMDLLNAQISKRKQSEAELKASQELWQFALEGAGDGVWDYDFQTNKIFFSKRYKEMLGYTDSEFTNNSDEWMSRIHPEDLHLVMKTDQDYFYKRQANHQVEYRIRHKDGHYIWVLDRGMVVSRTPEGLPARIIGTHTDITERKLAEQAIITSEEKYRSILANMNLGLLEVDNDDMVRFANQSFCEMSGYGMDEMIGKKAAELFASGEELALLGHKTNLRKKGLSDAYEITVKNKKGEVKWWLISGAPRYNDQGELVGSIGIHLDITDRKRLELELNEAREIAEQSVKTKEAFLANMSHEIRTPMNAIIGMGHQLEKTELKDQQRFFLNTINTAADHLLVVIHDILDISKIEAGKLELEQTGFVLADVLQHVARIMKPRAEEKGLAINSVFDKNIAPVLIGDPHRINQVLLNLISNAVKFTEKRTIDIEVKLLQAVGVQQIISFNIRDTGIGIEAEFLEHIFDKFSQEERTTARKYGGTGLGMAITRELVELMDGNIRIRSEKGVGTEILIQIPFATGETGDLPVVKKDLTDTGSLRGVRILLAEDNEMNRLVANIVLKNYGVLITEANNGAEAVEELKQNQFDIVLMDVQMPVLNGMEATAIIRKDLKLDIPIIALTANAIKGDKERYLAMGMNGFISKPFEENDLINAIVTLLKLETANTVTGEATKDNQPYIEPLFSLKKLLQIGRGDKEFVNKMVQLFLQQMPETLLEMHTAFRQTDMQLVRKMAHKIKPMIDSLEIVSLKNVVRELENANNEIQPVKRTAELIGIFDKTINKVLEEMKLL